MDDDDELKRCLLDAIEKLISSDSIEKANSSDPPAQDPRERYIREAIRLGGRANSFDLLALVAHSMAAHAMAARGMVGADPPSPALAQWFTAAVNAIAAGKTADEAFGLKRRQGRDPIAHRAEDVERDLRILDAVAAARAEGYPTSANAERESCFDVAARQLKLSEKTVRSKYYEWEVEHLSTPEIPSKGTF